MHARKDRPPRRRRSNEMKETIHFAALWGRDAGRYDRAGSEGRRLRFRYSEFPDLEGRPVAALSAFTPAGADGIEGFHALWDLPLN